MALIIPRSEFGWPAGPSRGSWTTANTNLGMIAHYDGSRGLLAKWRSQGHAACVTYWKNTRSAHINGNGWADIGYAYFACPCGKILEGRGFGRQQAAEMPTPGKMQNGNSRYISVTFGLGPSERPTDNAINGFRALRSHLMAVKHIAGAVFGHRDFTSTDCPGDVIFAMTRDGTLETGSEPTPIPPLKGDPVAALPTLKAGDRSTHVLTLRAQLFQVALSSRYTPNPSTTGEDVALWTWLRDQQFTPALKADVVKFQKTVFPDESAQWDGVVGPRTWGKLLRTT